MPGISFARVSATTRFRVRLTRNGADAAAVIVVALVFVLPALLRSGFVLDFANHQWLVWVQDHAISASGRPTYFLHTDSVQRCRGGVFDPFFMFYGGTLYAIAGALSVLAGHRPGVAIEATIVLSVAASYGGILWLARQLGVRSWMAHAPAVTFAASAYYVTNLYGRGAWSEFVATSALPLLVASGVRIARSPRLEAVPCALFVASAIVASGSHNITLLLGSITFAVALVALRVALRRPLTVERRRIGVARRAAGTRTVCERLVPPARGDVRTRHTDRVLPDTSLEGFGRVQPSADRPLSGPSWVGVADTPALYVEAPVWMLGWALGALALLWRRVTPALRRAAFVFVLVLAALLALILVESLYDALPRVLAQIQYPYRLNTYVALAIAGLVLIAVLTTENAVGRARRRLVLALAVATSITVATCAWQLFVPEHGSSRPPGCPCVAELGTGHVVQRRLLPRHQRAGRSIPATPAT